MPTKKEQLALLHKDRQECFALLLLAKRATKSNCLPPSLQKEQWKGFHFFVKNKMLFCSVLKEQPRAIHSFFFEKRTSLRDLFFANTK